MTINDAHCHFFSPGFFRALSRDLPARPDDPEHAVPASLGWEPFDSDAALADRWASELQTHEVSRAMLIASAPGDEAGVAAAVARHPTRFVGAFMLNPLADDAGSRLEEAFAGLDLRTVCLFPAMQGFAIDDPRVLAVYEAAARHRRTVFIHCGQLSVGARKKLGLPSRFDLRRGDPLGVAAVAVRYPTVPFIIPHFGAGFFREALMAADAAPNILFDTSSSNGWLKFNDRLTLGDVFTRALDVVGPSRLLFGTDSSFFPRGWHKAVCDNQRSVVTGLGLDAATQAAIFGGNFDRIFA
jgi:predicted TIM-barrel fold metal-dependent hydrolase